ncbi:cation:proton antiporter [Dyella sp. EPa41]|uniref:cation:proton antiporter n=1 Tax=Dyella sp. EPa41 TaxID=1561194 RepID=UPI001F273D83|nr:cation:proton antiporter [Dyella sp. EPa41]
MSAQAWLLVLGMLLLFSSLLRGWTRRTPVTPFVLYVLAGILLGPWFAGRASIDLVKHAPLLERATELALVVSLFINGLKLRALWHGQSWSTGMRLAFPAMLLTIGMMVPAVHYLFTSSWSEALLFAAAVAPTDPVLASLVSVDDADDRDGLRVALSTEAGLNDGGALPLLLLALLLFHPTTGSADLWRWFLRDVAWALPSGIGLGFGLALLTGALATHLKARSRDTGPNDFLALALLAITYAAAQYLHASVFLASFAAGLGLRHAEWRVVKHHPHPQTKDTSDVHPPAEVLVNPNQRDSEVARHPWASIGLVVSDALSFGDTLERLIGAGVLLFLGIALASYASLPAVALSALLFLVARPLAVLAVTARRGLRWPRRLLLGWLGIRGLGSLSYLAYAITHGLPSTSATRLSGWVVTLVVLSIVLHGMSTQPLMTWRASRIEQRNRRDARPK